jgi:streptogramin lyase
MQSRFKLAALLIAAPLAGLLLQGCATGVTGRDVSTVTPAPAVRMQGTVHGGQQPISGATIQLYAVNTTTSKGASTALIGSTVLSDANGNFNVTDLYTCPTGAQVYIAATGGDPGGGANSSIALLAGLGPCSSLTASTFILINEITTVGTVYALAPFMADVAHVGAAPANLQGLTNAFQTEAALVNNSSGSTPGPMLPSNATAPTVAINSLADAVAACINSATGSSQCTTLFSAATVSGTTPTDTVQALLGIARNPGNNASSIYMLAAPASPFQPTFGSAPNDWSLALNFSGGGLAYPFGLAVDGSGNVWVANAGGFSVSEFNSLGAPVSATGYSGGGLLAPQSIAVDLSGNVWVANTGASSVVKLSSTGSILSGSGGFTNGGIGAATGIAIDKTGDAWVTNFDTNTITELDTNGNALNGSPIPAGAGSAPVSISIDPASDVWVSNSGSGNVAMFSISGVQAGASPFTDGFLQGGAQVATTSAGSPWVGGMGDNSLDAFSVSGTALAASPVAGGGLNLPAALAVDGSDTIWVANAATAGSISAFTPTGVPITPSTGLGSLNTPSGIAIDASGNIWTANSGANTLTEFIGLATPVVTPLAARIR